MRYAKPINLIMKKSFKKSYSASVLTQMAEKKGLIDPEVYRKDSKWYLESDTLNYENIFLGCDSHMAHIRIENINL